MPQLPPPPSKRRTAARQEKLFALEEMLLTDPRLGEITTESPTCSERDLCIHMQQVLDDYVCRYIRRRAIRDITWGQISGSDSMLCVEIAHHRYFPDHIIKHGDFTIALEVKRYTGQSSIMQQVIGQSIIYSQRYGFTVAFIADVTKEGQLAAKMNAELQPDNDFYLQSELWHFHNTIVVCRHVKEILRSP
jgi:hypothetical protein